MTVTTATDVPAANGLPEYCDLKGSVATDGEGAGPNAAGFEIDLPANWNHRFIFNGGGGFDGSVSPATPQELTKGYATASTDSGHSAAVGATFAFTSPGVPNEPKLIDYFYRSRHQVGIAAKQLVLAYYGAQTINHSYFSGCSNGGRQGLMEAMRYPNDYDGIVSGAPWMDPLGTSFWYLKNIKALITAYIPYSSLPAINAAVLANCDAADGVVDGLVQNPAKCSFNPDSLVPQTLSQAQADALKLILKPVAAEDGELIYPGSSMSELNDVAAFGPFTIFGLASDEFSTPPDNPAGPQPWNGGMPINWLLADGVIADLGYYDPSVNLIGNLVETNDVVNEQAQELLYQRLALDLADQPSRLGPFLAKGGKLLLWHGYGDSIISPYRTVWFYEDLAEMRGGYHKVQEQVRLFMLPNVEHCGGGSGPNVFDSLTAIENWVEQGMAPNALVATHFTNNNPALGADRTMPLCTFPSEARYKGSGDVNSAANWICSQNRLLLQVGPNGVEAGVAGHGGERN